MTRAFCRQPGGSGALGPAGPALGGFTLGGAPGKGGGTGPGTVSLEPPGGAKGDLGGAPGRRVLRGGGGGIPTPGGFPFPRVSGALWNRGFSLVWGNPEPGVLEPTAPRGALLTPRGFRLAGYKTGQGGPFCFNPLSRGGGKVPLSTKNPNGGRVAFGTNGGCSTRKGPRGSLGLNGGPQGGFTGPNGCSHRGSKAWGVPPAKPERGFPGGFSGREPPGGALLYTGFQIWPRAGGSPRGGSRGLNMGAACLKEGLSHRPTRFFKSAFSGKQTLFSSRFRGGKRTTRGREGGLFHWRPKGRKGDSEGGIFIALKKKPPRSGMKKGGARPFFEARGAHLFSFLRRLPKEGFLRAIFVGDRRRQLSWAPTTQGVVSSSRPP